MPEDRDPNGECLTEALQPLFDAIGKGDRERIDRLLSECPSLVHGKAEEWERPTALHAAARRANTETIALLLERGADPACPDAFGNTPLHWVVSAEASAEAIEASIGLLAERPPGLAAVNHNGHTPLRQAIWNGRLQAQALLRARGAPLVAPRPTWTPPGAVVAAVTRTLSRAWNGPVTLGAAYQLRQERVLRFDVAAAPEVNGQPAPASVVVKRAHEDPERPYDPETTDQRNPAVVLLQEWAGVRFLTEMPGSGEYALRLYGGDQETGLFVIEDLGDGEALVDCLMSDDPRRAEEALRLLAVSLGRMHAETAGRRERYQAHREAVGARVSWRWWEDLRERREPLHQGFQTVDVTAAAARRRCERSGRPRRTRCRSTLPSARRLLRAHLTARLLGARCSVLSRTGGLIDLCSLSRTRTPTTAGSAFCPAARRRSRRRARPSRTICGARITGNTWPSASAARWARTATSGCRSWNRPAPEVRLPKRAGDRSGPRHGVSCGSNCRYSSLRAADALASGSLSPEKQDAVILWHAGMRRGTNRRLRSDEWRTCEHGRLALTGASPSGILPIMESRCEQRQIDG
jgi:hypothetical protein